MISVRRGRRGDSEGGFSVCDSSAAMLTKKPCAAVYSSGKEAKAQSQQGKENDKINVNIWDYWSQSF